MNTNLIIFAGFVGADPVSGKASIPVAKFSIASTFKSKDKEETTWLKVACFQKTAEFAQKYVKKGARVQVIGKIKNDDYESNGNKIKSVEVSVDNLQIIDWPDKQEPASTPVSVDEIKNPFA